MSAKSNRNSGFGSASPRFQKTECLSKTPIFSADPKFIVITTGNQKPPSRNERRRICVFEDPEKAVVEFVDSDPPLIFGLIAVQNPLREMCAIRTERLVIVDEFHPRRRRPSVVLSGGSAL